MPILVPPKPKPPFIQRTPDEMTFRREMGLCYDCDDKWNSTHCCKGRVLLFIADPEKPNAFHEFPNLDTTHFSPDHQAHSYLTPSIPHISLNALYGLPTPETLSHIWLHQSGTSYYLNR